MESNRPPNPSPDPEVGPPPWAQLPPGIEAGPPDGTDQANGQNGQGGGNGGRGGFQGDITAVDGNTLTVQTAAGAIKVVIAGNTSILKTASGSRSDLTVGKAVQIRLDVNASNGGGNGNTAGAVTASSIVAEPTQ